MEFLRSSFLWRVIGDEMVFVLPIQAEEEIAPAVDEIFELTQRVTGHYRMDDFMNFYPINDRCKRHSNS